MKKVLFLSLLSVSCLLYAGRVLAQTATDSSTGLRDSVKQKVEEELAQIVKSVSKKAFLGTITAKADASITLNNYHNQARTIIVGTDTAIKLKNGRDGTPADLKTADYILVMGDVDSAGTMTAKRILVISEPAADKRETAYGTITKTTSSSVVIDNLKNESVTVKVTSATKYTGTTKLSNLQVGDKILAITSDSTALVLHVITPAPSPTSTPAPSPAP
jgi:hypothetical protein